MSRKITYEDVTEVECLKFVTSASDLGWAPGEVPQTAPTTLGNGKLLRCTGATPERFTYQQDFGCILLTVFND